MKPLVIDHVTKIFSSAKGEPFKAVDGVSFVIEPGNIYGLLGPNGAGKSTLISMISGMTLPDRGSIEVFGVDVAKDTLAVKHMLGVVPQEIVVETPFTVEEVLYYFSGMYGVPRRERKPRIGALLRDLNLEEKMYDPARNLSGGMKRRLMIAKAMLHRPKLLILDEPTAGVDVSLRQKIWELVRRLNEEGTTILFTTHYLEEAEQLCESITLVDHGRVVTSGRLKEIQQSFSRNAIHFELFDRSVAPMSGVVPIGSEYEYPMTDLAKDVAALTAFYHNNIKSIRSEAASLEQIFLKLTTPQQK